MNDTVENETNQPTSNPEDSKEPMTDEQDLHATSLEDNAEDQDQEESM